MKIVHLINKRQFKEYGERNKMTSMYNRYLIDSGMVTEKELKRFEEDNNFERLKQIIPKNSQTIKKNYFAYYKKTKKQNKKYYAAMKNNRSFPDVVEDPGKKNASEHAESILSLWRI